LAAAPITINSGSTAYFRIVGFGANSTTGTGGIVGNLGSADFTLLGDVASLLRSLTWGGGDGVWDSSSANWTEGGSSTTFAIGNDANISGGTLTVAAGGVTAGTVNVSGAGNTTLTGGALSAAAISKTGAGTLNLNSVGTYSSGVTIDGGTVQATVNSALSGNVTVNGDGSLNVGATTNTVAVLSVTDGSISGSGKITANSTAVTASTGSNNTISAEISGSGSLTKGGAGTSTLSGVNTYTGDTIVSGGVLQTSGSERISDASILKPGTGSIFRLGGNETVRAIDSGAASSVVDLQNNNLTIGSGSTSNSFSGSIQGSGTVTKIGTGIQSWDSMHTFTGGMTLKDGSIRMQGSGSRATNAGIVTMVSNAFGTGVLTLEGGRIYSSSLTNSGTPGRTIYNSVSINGDFAFGLSNSLGQTGDLTVSTNVTGVGTTMLKSATITADSVVDWQQGISGSGFNLTKSGASLMTMRGLNSLDTVIVSQGRLDMRGASTVNTINVANGAILGYGTVNNSMGSASINLAAGSTFGQVAAIGTTDADRTIANNINIQGDVNLGVGGFGNYLSGNIDLGGANRTLNMVNSTYFSGVIQNGGVSFVATNKTISFAGASSYSGDTIFSANTGTSNLIYANNTTGSAFGSGSLLVQSGNVLGGSGTIAGATTMESGSSLRPGNSPGVLNFGSNLTLSTGANLVWELWANTVENSPASYDQIVVGGNLLFSGSNGITLDFGTSAGGSSVNWTDTFWGSQQSWTVFGVAGTTTGFSNLSLLNSAYIDATGVSLATARTGASFSIAQVGSDVVVNYIPEPSSSSLMLLGLAGLVGLRAFRRKV